MNFPPQLEKANKLNEEGKYVEALALYDEVLAQNPKHPMLLGTIGTLYLRDPKTVGLSISLLTNAIENCKKKAPTELYSNLGLAYKYSGQPKLALEYMRKAAESDPTAGTLTNYGSFFVETDNPAEGKKILERAIRLEPGLALAHWNLSLCLLSTAHQDDGWGKAWDEYEYGQHTGGMRFVKLSDRIPTWDGSPGKKVMVFGEQGLGDEIMFGSMIPDLMKDAKEVILDCHPRLTTLFSKSFGVKCYGTRKEQELDWLKTENPDAVIAVGSLGKFYRRSKDKFTGEPYLKAEPLPRDAESRKKFRVGISWTGGRSANRVARRSVPLNWWRSILNVPGCEFVSLQYSDGSEAEVESVNRIGYSISQPPEAKAKDYYEAARLVASCDLVITVCTSVVHLAGALGVPCWVMVPRKPAWRYQSSGPMPWYRSVRLYRQPSDDQDSWLPVVQRVGADLDEKLSVQERKVA